MKQGIVRRKREDTEKIEGTVRQSAHLNKRGKATNVSNLLDGDDGSSYKLLPLRKTSFSDIMRLQPSFLKALTNMSCSIMVDL
eukprot:scaffold1717_cov117-Cylindrotheca_fusiformis.AAC.3